MRKILPLLLLVSLLTHRMAAQCTNRCLDFDPASPSDYLQPFSSPVTGNSNFTIEARFFCTSTGTNLRRLFALSSGTSRFEMAESGGALRFIRQVVGGSLQTSNITSPNIRDNAWHHLAVTRNSATVRVYLDGVQVYSTAGFTGSLATTSMRIGASLLSPGTNFHWDGRMDELRIWDVERTVAEINEFRLCWAPCPAPNLRAYYHFDQGVGGGNNTTVTTANDCTGQFNAGLFNFLLTAGNNSNWVCNDDPIFLNGPCCSASFTAAQQGCGTVAFTNTTTGNFTYAWDFGDTNASTQTSPTHTYTTSGTYTVTLTATPLPSGAPCSTQQTITVTADNTPPMLVCKDLTINYLATPLSITPNDVLKNWSDNCCQNPTFSITGQNTFDCADVCQTRTVTLLATDCNGNTSNCTATVTVQDGLAPTALCKNVNIGIGSPGTVTINPADVDAGSTDNCPPVTLSLLPNTFGCPTQGCEQAHTVTLQASDCQGNTATCTATVTVRDVLSPTLLNCPPSMFMSAAPGQCGAVMQNLISATDNCGAPPSLSFSMSGATTASGSGNGSGTLCNIGITTVTYAAADVCNNTATCSFNVQVIDAQPPVITNCPPNTTVNGSIVAGAAIVTWPALVMTDNCPGTSLVQVAGLPNGSFFPCGGTTNVVYQATDLSGNTARCQFTVTVNCPPCTCGTFSDMTFSQNGGTPLSFKCGDFLPVQCPVDGSTLTLSGKFRCEGDTCAPSDFKLVNSDGTQIGSGSISGGNFTWSFNGFIISNPGWYELYLTTNCGDQASCRCTVRFTVPDCPQFSCDSISAIAVTTPPPTAPCCPYIFINNKIPNFAASVNLQVVSGGSLVPGDVTPGAGWNISGFSTGTSVLLDHVGGQIPLGNFSCGRICLSNLTASTQVLAVQYLSAAGQVICADTLELGCDFCIAITRDTITCSEASGALTLKFCVQVANTNPFNVNSLVLMGPTGVAFSPSSFSLPNVPPGATYCTLTTAITLPPGTNPDSLCVGFTAHEQDVTKGQPPGRCCMIKACFDLPNCCPNTATAMPVTSADGDCCWKITLNQPPGTAQSVTLNVIPVPGSSVTVGSIGFAPGWLFVLDAGLQSVTFTPNPLAPLPATINLPIICFDVPNGSPQPQLLEVVWSSASNEEQCRDTLEFNCEPDTLCAALAPLSLSCNASGQNVLSVLVTNPFSNPSSVVPDHVALVNVTPAGALVGPSVFPVGPLSPGSSTVITPIVLQGAMGTEVCFRLNLYRNAVPNVFEECCVTEDSFCVTLLDCIPVPPKPPGSLSVLLFPNPSPGSFTLTFSELGSPANGRVRLRDVAGRLLREEEVPAGSLLHTVVAEGLGSGLFFVEFLEHQTRVWREKLSVIR